MTDDLLYDIADAASWEDDYYDDELEDLDDDEDEEDESPV